jgi:hypothetical protein
MQCFSRCKFFRVKKALEYCIKCKCKPISRKMLNNKLVRLSPSNVHCYSRIQSTQDTLPFRSKFCISSNSVCPVTSQSVTCISQQISKRLRVFLYNRLSLIHHLITVHNSSTVIYNLFSVNHYAMECNVPCLKIWSYHHAQYTLPSPAIRMQVYQHFGTNYCLLNPRSTFL